ncbi:MAG: helix-turn-helix transcriptional regulator [Sciscionella sp.]
MSVRIPVYVSASDPISEAGVIAGMRSQQELRIIDQSEVGAATVGVVVVECPDEETERLIKRLQARGCRRIVLLATVLDEAGLLVAVGAGVCALVRRSDATPARLTAIVVKAAAGDATLPPDMLGKLLDQMSRLQNQVLAPRGFSLTGLSTRETQVLCMLADGMETKEIAANLVYSERTVKNVLHDVTRRFQLRNRCHAVAYALREGLI